MREQRRYRGLLIGNATFPRDPHTLPELNGPGIDIEQLKQALTDARVGLFRTEDLQQLPDRNIQDIRERINALFTTATREDVLLLYYSGHGQLDEHGTLYLCAKDTTTSLLQATALSAIEINNMIRRSPATTTVVILDCCHSGAFKGATASVPLEDSASEGAAGHRSTVSALAAGRGRYVLTSSRSTQLTLAATSPGRPSPFTGMLVRGLQHAEATGHLTVVELYRQVHRWMTETAVITPQLKIAGEGDIIIARRPNPSQPTPTTESAPIPEKIPAQDSTGPGGTARGEAEGATAIEPQPVVSQQSPWGEEDRALHATDAQRDARDTEEGALREQMGTEQVLDPAEPGAVVSEVAHGATADKGGGDGPDEPPSCPGQAPPSPLVQDPRAAPQPPPTSKVIIPRRSPKTDQQTNQHKNDIQEDVLAAGFTGSVETVNAPAQSPAGTSHPQTGLPRDRTPGPHATAEVSPTDTGAAARNGPRRRSLILSAVAAVATIGVPTGLYLARDSAHPSISGSKPAPSLHGSSPAGTTPKIAWTTALQADTIDASAHGVAVSTTNAAGTSSLLYALAPATGRALWKTTFSSQGGCAASDTAVYCASGGKLYALDWKGHRLWSAPAPNLTSYLSVYLGRNLVYAWSNDDSFASSTMYAYGLDGHKHWSVQIGAIADTPAEANGILYVGSYDNHLYALDAATGTTRWSAPLDGDVGTPAVIGSTIAVGTSAGNSLLALTTSGKRSWTAPGVSSGQYSMADAAGQLFVSNSGDAVFATTTTGQPAWSFPNGTKRRAATGDDQYNGSASPPTVLQNTAYFFLNNTLNAVNAANGTKKWDLPILNSTPSFLTSWQIRGYSNMLYCTEGTHVSAVHVA